MLKIKKMAQNLDRLWNWASNFGGDFAPSCKLYACNHQGKFKSKNLMLSKLEVFEVSKLIWKIRELQNKPTPEEHP